MSEPQHDHLSVTGTGHDGDDGARLELKPALPRTGFVDGGWWPRSRDLRAEAADLVAGLSARVGRRIGPILRIGFGSEQWEPVGRLRLATPTGRVALSGFPTFGADLVWVTSYATALRPIALLVVPPDTPRTEALAALRRASTADNTEQPSALLERHDVVVVDKAAAGATTAGSSYTLLDIMK